jgi:hypothetical protein
MSLQSVINHAQNIKIDRRAVVAQSLSRSQHIKTTERGYRLWRFTVTPSPGWKWADYRPTVEAIYNKDRITETEISLANNSNMAWTVAYQGEFTSGELSTITISAASGTSITLSNLPSVASSTIAFKAGDLIQPSGSRYPYVVTAPVTRGSGSTITLTVNRGVISDITLVGASILVGNNVTWRVIPMVLPAYNLTPGKLVNFDGDFELIEVIQ